MSEVVESERPSSIVVQSGEDLPAVTSPVPAPADPAAAPAAERPPERPKVLPDDTLAQTAAKTISRHYDRMLGEIIGLRAGGDAEAVHDMRVAVRRIRVALDVFRPGLKDKPSRRLAKRLKVLGARLGQLREVDVLLEGLETYESRGAGRSRQLRPLRSHWTARQGKAHARVVAHLESEAFIEDCAAVETFLLDPPRAALKKVRAVAPRDEIRLAAPNLLFRAWGDVRAADPSWDSVTFAELHRLRLAIKVTRYTLEFLSDILGEETPSLLRQLRRLQDGLGGFTDADVACQRVQTFLSDWTETQKGVAPTARPHPQPVVRYLAVCHSRRHAALVRVEAMWRKFPHDRFRRRLAQAASAA